MEYYSAIKKNTFESVLMRWMKLEPIIQSEVSQKEKHQYSILFPFKGCVILHSMARSCFVCPLSLLWTLALRLLFGYGEFFFSLGTKTKSVPRTW